MIIDYNGTLLAYNVQHLYLICVMKDASKKIDCTCTMSCTIHLSISLRIIIYLYTCGCECIRCAYIHTILLIQLIVHKYRISLTIHINLTAKSIGLMLFEF